MFLEKVAEVFELEVESEKVTILGYAFREYIGDIVIAEKSFSFVSLKRILINLRNIARS